MRALVKGLRLKQATKNLFLYAALVFADKLFDPHAFFMVTLAFVLFTMVASCVYLLNDLLDVEEDRLHPKKRFRPIASGALPVRIAWIALTCLGIGGVLTSFLVNPWFGITVLTYLLLQIAYCVRLKHVALIDIFVIASGFVLRTVAGGTVIGVYISPWLLLCTLQLALLLGSAKRRQELVLNGENVGETRAILKEYSVAFLDQMINVVVGVTIVCYSVYSIQSDTAQKHPHLWLTVPFVIYGVVRYLYLVYFKGWGGAPDEVLLKDRSLQVAIFLWFIIVLLLFKFDAVGQPLFRLKIGG